jgi:hypothetical protein
VTRLLGGSPLFRKIMASILLASVFFLSLLNIVVYYSNEILEDALLANAPRPSQSPLPHPDRATPATVAPRAHPGVDEDPIQQARTRP